MHLKDEAHDYAKMDAKYKDPKEIIKDHQKLYDAFQFVTTNGTIIIIDKTTLEMTFEDRENFQEMVDPLRLDNYSKAR